MEQSPQASDSQDRTHAGQAGEGGVSDVCPRTGKGCARPAAVLSGQRALLDAELWKPALTSCCLSSQLLGSLLRYMTPSTEGWRRRVAAWGLGFPVSPISAPGLRQPASHRSAPGL